MGSIMNKAEWKKLRENVPQGLVKVSVGKKLDQYHKAKKTEDQLKRLKEVKKAVEEYKDSKKVRDFWHDAVNVKKSLTKKDHTNFLTGVGRLLRAIDERLEKLEAYVAAKKQAMSLNMQTVLKSKKLYQAFYSFSKKEQSHEGLDFFSMLKAGISSDIIYTTFIKAGARQELNLPGGVMTPLRTKAGTGNGANPTKDDFQRALKQCVEVYQNDTLPRFVQSEECMQVIAKL